MKNTLKLFERRKARTRFNLKSKNASRPRLSVYRSNSNIYAQIIDDKKGVTVVASSSKDKDLKITNGSNKDAATIVGAAIAKKAIEAGVVEVVFDRGGYLFHGRVKALAEAAREAGLKF